MPIKISNIILWKLMGKEWFLEITCDFFKCRDEIVIFKYLVLFVGENLRKLIAWRLIMDVSRSRLSLWG